MRIHAPHGQRREVRIVSAKILPLRRPSTRCPRNDRRPKSPSSCTVPVTPPTLTASHHLNGRSTSMNAPAAKLASMPLRPRRSPGGAREQRRERRGLDAEVAEYAEDRAMLRVTVTIELRYFVNVGSRCCGPCRTDQRSDAVYQPAADEPNASAARIFMPRSTPSCSGRPLWPVCPCRPPPVCSQSSGCPPLHGHHLRRGEGVLEFECAVRPVHSR